MADSGKFNGFALGFFLGAVAGIAIGFLYAPKTGSETRAMLREKAEELREKAGEATEKAREMAVDVGKKVRERTGG
jgi:gas vesicle protein